MDGSNPVVRVSVYSDITESTLKNIKSKRKPAVLKNIYIGDCVTKWSPDYLIDKVGSVPIKVHVSNEGKMNFLTKNFTYKTLLFDEFVRLSLSTDNTETCVKGGNCFYYLRSLSNERRGKKVAVIDNEFPTIAKDVKLPNFFSDEFFSSVLRIGSKDIQVWTHYDVMDNLLVQVRGRKRVVLFSPSDAPFLYLNGDKSEVVEIDNPDLNKFPKFKLATRYECVLEPGDILFIPSLWFHNTLALTDGINVNAFWKNLEDGLYDKNDFYGNKDLLPAAKMLQMVTKALDCLNVLPDEYKDFYAKRAILTVERYLKDNISKKDCNIDTE